jgi:heat shock protein HslJ
MVYWGYQKPLVLSVSGAKSHKNAIYKIVGENVKLENGIESHPAAPGSASMVTTKYFGNEVSYDFDKDGREDKVFILTQDMGGSGTFYFLVYALNKEDGYVGSEALYIGDRIAPQTTELSTEKGKEGMIIVNYADRKPGESFDIVPSLGKSLYVKLDLKSMQPGEVVQNFEGEADTSRMTLDMNTWSWIRTELNDGTVVTPKDSDKFKLTFKKDKTFSASTDCNGIGGEYGTVDGRITFTKMMSTLMYCEGSQESDFSKYLENTASYFFTSKGELVLELKFDSGVVIFR